VQRAAPIASESDPDRGCRFFLDERVMLRHADRLRNCAAQDVEVACFVAAVRPAD